MYTPARTAAILTAVAAFTAAMMFATSSVVVERGDTLSRVAREHSLTLAELVEWNNLENPDVIFEGQVLVLEAPGRPSTSAAESHAVTAGDTLWLIARRYGSTVAAIAQANDLRNPNHIVIGQRLRVGGAEQSAAPTTTTAVTATTTTVSPSSPSSGSYTVAAGDTLFSIAQAHGIGVHELAELNDLPNPDLLGVGRTLMVPGAIAPPTTTVPVAAPTTSTAPRTPDSSTPSTSATPLADAFSRWSTSYGVPQDLLEALTWKESNWQPSVTGPSGHLGIGQLSPDTVIFVEERLLGLDLDPLSMSDGVQLAARFLRYLLDRTDGEREALAAWNQGLWGFDNDGMSEHAAAFADSVLQIRRLRS